MNNIQNQIYSNYLNSNYLNPNYYSLQTNNNNTNINIKNQNYNYDPLNPYLTNWPNSFLKIGYNLEFKKEIY